MCTEWRSNIWMIIELSIVGLIVAVIAWVLALLAYAYKGQVGYDLTDIYVGTCNFLDVDADNYVKYEDRSKYSDDFDVIMRRLRANPYVAEVAKGGKSMPYNYNYNGNGLFLEGNDSLQYIGNTRYMSPELVRLLKLVGPNGETSEQLAAVLERGEILISPHTPSTRSCEPEVLMGKDVTLNQSTPYHVGAIAYGITRDDYEGINHGCIILPFTDRASQFPSEIVVKVKPGMGRKFMESINTDELEQGNSYVNNFTSINDMRDAAQQTITTLRQQFSACALFLMVAIFLGFLGSFWFRTQQRVPEIALRKVNGATPRQIFSRLIGEGMILLLIAAVIFTPIYLGLVYTDALSDIMSVDEIPESGSEYFGYLATIYGAYLATIAILALIIIAGIWFPARRAMRVQPAEALKDQ
jgi:putative ABC transport system permease protein